MLKTAFPTISESLKGVVEKNFPLLLSTPVFWAGDATGAGCKYCDKVQVESLALMQNISMRCIRDMIMNHTSLRARGDMAYGRTGVCRRNFTNPPTYN